MEIRIFNKILSINLYNAPAVKTWGILNRTPDNYFLPFFDFDGVRYEVVEEEIDFLNKNFGLGPFIVRESSSFVTEEGVKIGNYHLIGFSKLTLPEYQEILKYSRCDPGFKAGFKLEPERAWVLRIGEKFDLKTNQPVKPFSKLIKYYYFPTKRILNKGMFKFFEILDGVKFNKKGLKFDDVEEVNLIYYQGSGKKNKEVVLWQEEDCTQ